MVFVRNLEILSVATATTTTTAAATTATKTIRATETIKTIKAIKAAKATKAAKTTAKATDNTELRSLSLIWKGSVWVPMNCLTRIEIANIQHLEFVMEFIHSCHLRKLY